MIAQRYPALQYRDFRIFWIGQFVSLIGTWMQSTVQPYVAYRLTGQPFYLGLIGFATAIPALFITLPGGVFIERLDKRKTVLVLQSVMMLQAFLLAYLTFTHQITIWHLVAIAFVLGSANALEMTARQSMFIDLVEKHALPNAIALNSMIFNAARVLGPSISAPFLILLADSGEGWAFLFNGISYLFVIGSLFMIRSRSKENRLPKPSLRDFMEGQEFVRKTPFILALILMVTIPAFFGFPLIQQIPVFARDIFRVVGETAGATAARNSYLVTFQGIGAFIAAIYLASFSGIKNKAMMLTLGQIVFAVGLVGLAFSSNMALALPMMMAVGWGTVTQLTLTNTLIQLAVPDHLRGRVIATYLWAMQGVAPFGSLFIGWLAQNWGAPMAVLLGGSVCLLGYLAFHVSRPWIRKTVM